MTEAQERAATAWKQVVRKRSIFDTIAGEGPMPPAIAVDYVMEVLYDRTYAVELLFDSAREWLRAKIPMIAVDALSTVCEQWRSLGEGLLRRMNPTNGIDYGGGLYSLKSNVAHTAGSGHFLAACNDWMLWIREVEMVFDLLDHLLLEAL